MKNSIYKINKYPQYTIEYYNDISDITDPELVSFIRTLLLIAMKLMM